MSYGDLITIVYRYHVSVQLMLIVFSTLNKDYLILDSDQSNSS